MPKNCNVFPLMGEKLLQFILRFQIPRKDFFLSKHSPPGLNGNWEDIKHRNLSDVKRKSFHRGQDSPVIYSHFYLQFPFPYHKILCYSYNSMKNTQCFKWQGLLGKGYKSESPMDLVHLAIWPCLELFVLGVIFRELVWR